MKTNRRIVLTIISFLLVALIVSACSSTKLVANDSPAQSNTGAGVAEPSEMDFEEEGQSDTSIDSGSIEPEKIITTVHLSLETTQFDSTIKNLNKSISTNKGYVENSSISNRNYTNKVFKYANYTIRIPKDNVDNFIDEVDSIGNIVSQETSKEDITKQYYDTESRLNLLKVKEERMTALLEKAEKMEDIIAIENQLSEIIHQKENLTKNIIDMDDKISYSVVYMDISEVDKLRTDITTNTTFSTKIYNAIDDSFYIFKMAMETIVFIFIYIFPYLLIGGAIAFVVLKFVRKRKQ